MKINPGIGTSFGLSLIFIGVLPLSACNSRMDCASTDFICAGLVTDPGGIDDHGLNQGAWEALQNANSENTLHYAEYIESTDPRDYLKNIEFFIDRGFDVILTVGPGQLQETLQTAVEQPEVQFLGINQTYPESWSNLHPVQFPNGQMGYLAGVVAAKLTKTSVVGAVCESSSFDSIRQYCEGFRLGVSNCGEMCGPHTNQSIDVLVRYREGGDPELIFNDPAWGEQTTRELIHRGADALFAIGGGTGQGAIRAAADLGVYAIGAEKDQWLALPEGQSVLITSIYGDPSQAVQEWFRLFNTDRQPAALEAPFIYAPFHNLEPSKSFDMEQTLDRVMVELEKGKVKIPEFR